MAVLGDYVAAVVAMAKTAGKPIAIERLDFAAKKATLREQSPGYARMLSQFVYAKFYVLILSRSAAEGVGLMQVNPAYSCVVGAYKFYGLNISSHEKAALVLARRALGFPKGAKMFQGTRRSPERMTSAPQQTSRPKGPRSVPRRRERHGVFGPARLER